jgi:hypothetical protein
VIETHEHTGEFAAKCFYGACHGHWRCSDASSWPDHRSRCS